MVARPYIVYCINIVCNIWISYILNIDTLYIFIRIFYINILTLEMISYFLFYEQIDHNNNELSRVIARKQSHELVALLRDQWPEHAY